MPSRYAEASMPHRLSRAAVAKLPPSMLAATLHLLDKAVHWLTRGRATFAGFAGGLPVVVLTTTGAKTGQPRTSPLVAIPHAGRLALVASNWGQARHPGWYHNLRAHPDAKLTSRGVTTPVRAHEVDGDEREDLWRAAVQLYPGYQAYQRRAAPRRIPILVLRPKSTLHPLRR